ncbi:MAG: hypothetical protein IPP90_09755 [Gemmatimonadaceae bacterium]|nr:hypothetical protein [Gemmatimonadaceae bacterium]
MRRQLVGAGGATSGSPASWRRSAPHTPAGTAARPPRRSRPRPTCGYSEAISAFAVRCNTSVTCGVMCVYTAVVAGL